VGACRSFTSFRPVGCSDPPGARISARGAGWQHVAGRETALIADHRRILRDLPKMAEAARQTPEEALRYRNYISFLEDFLVQKPES
jgi:hypothetical protein